MSTKTRTNPKNPFALTRAAGRREAFGYVTRDSAADLKEWVKDLLFDGTTPRPYTRVCAYEYSGYRPEVATGQKAEGLKLIEASWGSAVQVVDTRSVWSLSGERQTQPNASSRGTKLEVLREGMYVVVSDRHLQARLRTPEGKLAWWHVALEQP